MMSPIRRNATSDSFNEIATVRIELRHADPLIWRQVEVPTSITLKVLHDIIQVVMGWFDYPPLILCVVSPNGSVMVMRTDGEHPEILTEHTEGAGFSTPINCMVVDRAGAAAHITIEPSGATTFH